jgi:hypothetical protein
MRHARTLGRPSLYRWIFLATLMLGLAASALYSSSLPVYSISGHTFLYDNEPFNFVTVELLDNAGNVIDSQQTQAGAFQFTAVAGTYSVRLNQPGYAYLGRLQSFELTANLECVDLWIGPDSWFPQQLPLCVSPDGSTNMTNTTPCAVDLTATAELTDGSSVTSPPVRIYFLPTCVTAPPVVTPTPTPAPTATPTPEPSPLPTATPLPSPQPTATPTPHLTNTNTDTHAGANAAVRQIHTQRQVR